MTNQPTVKPCPGAIKFMVQIILNLPVPEPKPEPGKRRYRRTARFFKSRKDKP
jgi:hypothetical protein